MQRPWAWADDEAFPLVAHAVAEGGENVIPEWVDVCFSDVVEADLFGGGAHHFADVVLFGKLSELDHVVWAHEAVVEIDTEGIGAVFVQGYVGLKFHSLPPK